MQTQYYRHLKRPKYKKIWGNSFGNKIGRLAQGMPNRVQGTNTMFSYTNMRYLKKDTKIAPMEESYVM